ncbi:MAG TPA: phage baseplate assembly protein V [Vicinamibacterales bacterium]|nr:phage baseplate assembly protein V [Vicinamibacterales bacterium]
MENEGLVSRLAELGPESLPDGFAIAPGVVKNNLDLIAEGRVQVGITARPAFEPWARLPAVGGGSGRGFLWVPQVGDEVLVAFAQNDERDAYVLGGLWSTRDRPPLTLPTDFLIKRVLKTGISDALGHEIVFDDALQSIEITSSTKQKITIDPLKIELANTAGTLTITMDNATQSISIQAGLKLELKAPQISIEGVQIDIKGTLVSVQAGGPCTLQGLPVKIN